ncbi:MAG: flagellin [Synergistaceae bacterium]|nr:flagellin [Synergistaceae bacterium]
MVIQHNIPALQTYNIVNNTSNNLQKSIAKLSSGLRINSAADDAAGLAISEKMRAQVRGLDKAVANTQDGISLIQTAEGALQETHSILQRMRELSVQAANDTLTQQDRSYVQVEIDQLKDEITRIGDTTQFNKKKLLNGDAAALWSSDNNETKAIINGGLRKTDQFGQKVSVEGNYKIRVKADPGQGEVQKSDIMKIKHDDVVINKTVNTDLGVTDVSVNNVAAGSYKIELAESNPGAGAGEEAVGLLTGAYGLGGTMNTTDSTITFQDGIGAPVTKITVSTTDGTEIWSTTGSDLFKYAEAADSAAGTTAADQSAFFEGRTSENSDAGPAFVGVKDEIIAAAAAKGINLSGFAEEPNEDSGEFTLSTVTKNGTAPGIKITYETAAPGLDPTSAIEVGGASPIAADSVFAVEVGDNLQENASILFEVTNIDTVNQQVTLKATATKLSQDGVNSTATQDNIVLSLVDGAPQENAVNLDKLFGGSADEPSVSINFNEFDGIDTLGISPVSEGAKFVYFVTSQTEDSNENPIQVNISGTLDSTWDEKWDNSPYRGNTLGYTLNGDNLADTEIHFKNFYLNEKTGNVEEGDIVMSTGSRFNMGETGALAEASTDPESMLARFDAAYIGKVATGDTKLRDLDKFWNSEGVFMLDDAKTITLNQGNGNTASVTLYANDTLDEVATKLNTAIADGLGQKKYVDDATKFVTFVGNGSTTNSESVDGTFLIRSVVPGKSGEITLSGDEDLLNALSLNTIQKSKETSFTVDVEDAHTGEVLKSGVKITGNIAKGLIDENVDVEFSELTGISASWNDSLKKFVYSSATEETTLHLADNTTVLQIGANEGEDLAMNIGDMRSHALGLDGVNVMSHDRAARSITIIDNAIDKVSTQRANLGAYQNRLEYTASNLTTASENLTSAESRIRDADMAKEMMNFTKLNIMLQAGNSMLAQANQQPQNVLSLIR